MLIFQDPMMCSMCPTLETWAFSLRLATSQRYYIPAAALLHLKQHFIRHCSASPHKSRSAIGHQIPQKTALHGIPHRAQTLRVPVNLASGTPDSSVNPALASVPSALTR